MGEKSDDFSYPICPRGTAAIILKTYSTYNIKWQFRSKYVTLGVQKKRRKKRKWRAREWAWFMRRRSKRIAKRHLKTLEKRKLRSLSGASADSDNNCQETKDTTKKSFEASLDANKRRRSTKVITKLQRMKAKVIELLYLY